MKYKNISKNDLTIPGIGLVKSGEIKNMPKGFNNSNFEKVVIKTEEVKKDNK